MNEPDIELMISANCALDSIEPDLLDDQAVGNEEVSVTDLLDTKTL